MDKLQVIQALEAEREQMIAQLHSLDLTILTLKQSMNMPDIKGLTSRNVNGSANGYSAPVMKYHGYAKAKSNKEKAAIILRQEGRFLHMRQIKAIAVALEPNEDPAKIEGQIAQAIYALKSDKSIIDIKIGKSNMNVFWGSKSWLNPDGTIKEAHIYDNDELAGNKPEKIEV